MERAEHKNSNLGGTGKTRVLLIDDDRKLCRLIKDYLEPMGYDVSAVHTGPQGVEQAAAQVWNVVILDVMLPGLDGFEVLKQIRRSSDVPVLMLTAPTLRRTGPVLIKSKSTRDMSESRNGAV